jgi:hypothetical protein
MARRKPEDIIALVDGQHDQTEPLRQRMEDDHAIYRLSPYDAGEGYQSYTSNEPQTYADKVMGWIAGSDMTVRIPHGGNDQTVREKNDLKERFLVGILRAADDRLCNMMMPPLQAQLAWYSTLRGWYAGRALLAKRNDGSTYVDITPWDPMNTYWEAGPDGLEWACYKIPKTKAQVWSQYRIKLDDMNGRDEDGVEVYDFYDKETNTIIIHNGKKDGAVFRTVKRQTKHGANRVPVFIGPVGSTPYIIPHTQSNMDDTIADVGESVFKANRETYINHNMVMSTMLEMVARSKRQGLKVTSRDGTKTLEEDPYLEGSEISLAQGEQVEPLGLMEIAKETGAFMGLVAGELQRGSLPHTVFGELPFQLSGFAINTLRQGVDTILGKYLRSIEKAYQMMFNIISDQYATGAFKAIEVSGMDRNRTYFSLEITPDVIDGAGTAEVTLVGQLPQDDMTKYSMAQIAREGPTPLLSDRAIRDRILAIQDADQMDFAIKEQMAERMLPEAAIWSLLQASKEQGREDLVSFYTGELFRILLEKQKAMQPHPPQPTGPPPMGPPPMGPPPMGGPPGLPPQVMPEAMMGVPPPIPTPQSGPLVAPGSPRPGSQGPGPRME